MMMIMMDTTRLPEGNKSFVAGLLAGMLAGGIVAALWSPRSGPQTRALVKEQAEDIALKAQATVREVVRHDHD
jgi:gas vesicle protein